MNYSKTLFLLLLLAANCQLPTAFAQDNEKISEAFKNSYANEKAGEYTKAIQNIKDVYADDNYEINLRLGWLHYSGGLFTESQTYYQNAMNLKPYSIEAKFGYVYPAAALGNWEQVKKQYLDILKIDANNTTALYRLGLIYYGAEDYQKAFTNFEKVVNLYPFDYDSLLMLGWTNFKLGKTREATILFQKVLWNSPGDASATEGLGYIK